MRDRQRTVVDEVLSELGAAGQPTLLVYNKIDDCSPASIGLLAGGSDALRVSAFSSRDMEALLHRIEDKLLGDVRTLSLPAERGELAALAYRVGEVLEQGTDEDRLLLKLRINPADLEKFGRPLETYFVENENMNSV